MKRGTPPQKLNAVPLASLVSSSQVRATGGESASASVTLGHVPAHSSAQTFNNSAPALQPQQHIPFVQPPVHAMANARTTAGTLVLEDTGEYWRRDRLSIVRRHGGVGADEERGFIDDDDIYDRVWSHKGKRIRVVDADEDEHIRWGPCGTRSAQAGINICILILQLITLLFLVAAAVTCWAYVYPNTVELFDAKVENTFGLITNLLITNVPVVEEEMTCLFGFVCNQVNDALAPILGTNLSCNLGGNMSLGDICPFSFAGLTHNISSSQMSEVLGSTWETSAPPISSQLHILKYDTGVGSSSWSSSSPPSDLPDYLSPSAEDTSGATYASTPPT